MTMSFSFLTATEILFGRGQSQIVAARIAAMGRRILLVHGRDASRCAWLVQALQDHGCTVQTHDIIAEPDIDAIQAGVDAANDARVILAFGGGAVIDAGKAIAALVPATRPMMDHLEVVGRGLPLDHAPLPFVAIPTTSGTGAEVTRNAVISVPEHRRKVSLRDNRMLPRLAIVDPALTDNCPRAVTLASGLDAITQVIEPYICTNANPLTDALCRDAIPRGLAALRVLVQREDPDARDEMAWVSLCGGLALANSGLGAVHGLAGPLGGLTGAAHGAICGALLPAVLVKNRAKVKDALLAARMDQVGEWIGAAFEAPDASIPKAADMLAAWSRDCGLAGLSALGIDQEAQLLAAKAAATSSSMKANPAQLTETDLMQIMDASV